MSEELFGPRTRFPHVHRAISLRQSLDDGAANQAIAETKRRRSLKRGSAAADLQVYRPETPRDRPSGSANGLSSVHLGAFGASRR